MKEGLLQKIYDATDGGLQIILHYYPQARGCDRPGKKFKARDEDDASAALKKYNGVWRMTDFGESDRSMAPIEICMREERLDFREALKLLAGRYGIKGDNESQSGKRIEPKTVSPDEKPGDYHIKTKDKPTEKELEILGPMVREETMKRYSYYSVEWYEWVKWDEEKGSKVKYRVTAGDDFPIFMHDCGTFKKIYKPLEQDKGHRFAMLGEKTPDYINGLDELRRAYQEHSKNVEAEEEAAYDEKKTPDTGRAKKSGKLPEAVICSGERDALNCAGMGYHVLWMNSETSTLKKKQYDEIMRMVDTLYNIPDIDKTGMRKGRELALQYPEIHTLELPEKLREEKDWRGKPCKDLRDWVAVNRSAGLFREMLKTAKPCRFWEESVSEKGRREYSINTLYMLHFLKCNGFGKITDAANDTVQYIRTSGYVVEESAPGVMKEFLKDWCKEHFLNNTIMNTIINSKRISEASMRMIDEAKPDFTNSTSDSQWLFFSNCAVEVTPRGCRITKDGDGRMSWEKGICRHEFRRLPESFRVEFGEDGEPELKILDKSSHYFRFLINASRVHWQEELEERAAGDYGADLEWMRANHWEIASDRLTEEEREEQTRHLMNKMYVIGYLLHSHKSYSKAYGVWIMENKVTEENEMDESSGGSGKSFMAGFLRNFKNMETVNGRNRNMTDDRFFLDRVTEETDILLIDDADRYMDFNYFYSMITGNMVVNYKNQKSKEIEFKDSPKVVITSNFPPRGTDGSTARRIMYCVFSDYYHQATDDNGYRETMKISDDFGTDLYTEEYKWEWWNQDYNFCIDCLQLYLQCAERNMALDPPMSNVRRRQTLQQIGDTFRDWADLYFAKDGGNTDRVIDKALALESLNAESKQKYTAKGFTKRLKAWCDVTEHVECLNPEGIQGRNCKGRIQRNIDGKTRDMIYVQTKGTEVDTF